MKSLFCALTVSASVAAQSAPNFSGKWAIQGGGGRGRGSAPTLTMNQVGTAVTGELHYFVCKPTALTSAPQISQR